jgi:outer membrane protein OmpA-like peptidoglycan-associated protein
MKTLLAFRQQVRLPAISCAGLFFLFFLAQTCVAGDRLGVTEVLQSIGTNWSDAQFSVDVSGLSDGEAILDQPMKIEYEAALKGYVSYLRVSSHGDMTLSRSAGASARLMGADSFVVKPPLGGELMVVLFSSKPLVPLLPAGAASIEVGADRAHAESLVHQIEQLKASGVLLTSRKYRYTVAMLPGGTEYTTRGIIRQVEGARQNAVAGRTSVKVPSHIEFAFNSDQITDQGKRDLDEFGEALIERFAGTKLELQGYTDDVGTEVYNLSLSQRRAEAARRYLVEQFGLQNSRIVATGQGMLKSASATSNEVESERKKNRRVDFIFSGRAAE